MAEVQPVPTDQRPDIPRIVPLFDGRATVTLRRLTPADFDGGVVELADELSEDEKYLRFFTARPAFIPQWAASLTEPADDVVALGGAFDHGELVGVANYTRSEVPDHAEVAVVVARYQHDRGWVRHCSESSSDSPSVTVSGTSWPTSSRRTTVCGASSQTPTCR